MKLEDLFDEMKTTKGNIPSPGEYVEKKYIIQESHETSICISTAYKWLKSVDIDFNPQGDVQKLQEINQFMAPRCKIR